MLVSPLLSSPLLFSSILYSSLPFPPPLISSPLLPGVPSSVQYQHGAQALYQGQSGSPPPTGRVGLPTNQQAPSARPTVPLAQGVPQQQQVTAKNQDFFIVSASHILF